MASHRRVHNDDLSVFSLSSSCGSSQHANMLQPVGLCSSCPRVMRGHRPLCTICLLITDRFASGGGTKLLECTELVNTDE